MNPSMYVLCCFIIPNGYILFRCLQLGPLRILFDLLNATCTVVPAFAGYLLQAGVREGESLLASTICSVILKCTKEKPDDTVLWHLGETALALCETLGWQAVDDGVVRWVALI